MSDTPIVVSLKKTTKRTQHREIRIGWRNTHNEYRSTSILCEFDDYGGVLRIYINGKIVAELKGMSDEYECYLDDGRYPYLRTPK